MPTNQHFSVSDFLKKMKAAYDYMHKQHALQTMWVMTSLKLVYVSYYLILTVAMVVDANLRFGNFAQTLVVLQAVMTLGLFVGSFLRFNWLEKLSYEQLMMMQFLCLILATLNCFYRGPLLIVLVIMLATTIISGYLSPKFTTDLVQKIGEEHLTRVESLLGFVLMLANTSGSLLATAMLQLFSLKNSWLLELGMMVSFMVVGEIMIYKNKH